MSKRSFDEMETSIMISDGPHHLATALIQTGQYSDLTFKHGEREWKVHRAFVCTQSGVIRRMVEAETLVSSPIIDLSEYKVCYIELLIDYLYTAAFSDGTGMNPHPHTPDSRQRSSTSDSQVGTGEKPDGPLIINCEMYILAHKFEIPGLEDLAARQYKMILYKPNGMRQPTRHLISTLLRILEVLPEENTKLKDIAFNFVTYFYSSLMDQECFLNALRQHPDLAIEMLQNFNSNPLPRVPPKCPNEACLSFEKSGYVRTNARQNWEAEGQFYCCRCETSFG